MQDNTPTTLIISKEEFKGILSERIIAGEQLIERTVLTNEELDQLETDTRLWIDYNLEMLKQNLIKQITNTDWKNHRH